MNKGILCKDCYGSKSPEECIGCTGYPEGTQFIFQGESERPIIIIPEPLRTILAKVEGKGS